MLKTLKSDIDAKEEKQKEEKQKEEKQKEEKQKENVYKNYEYGLNKIKKTDKKYETWYNENYSK